jgi:hypothetical protein
VPVVALAEKIEVLATPKVLVATVSVAEPPANVPLAPLAGALNVTFTPETGFPLASFTVAAKGLLKALLTRALWPPPEAAVTLLGAPGVFVKEKEAGVDTPGTVALTE